MSDIKKALGYWVLSAEEDGKTLKWGNNDEDDSSPFPLKSEAIEDAKLVLSDKTSPPYPIYILTVFNNFEILMEEVKEEQPDNFTATMQQVESDILSAFEGLRSAVNEANPVQTIILLDLQRKAWDLHSEAKALRDATDRSANIGVECDEKVGNAT